MICLRTQVLRARARPLLAGLGDHLQGRRGRGRSQASRVRAIHRKTHGLRVIATRHDLHRTLSDRYVQYPHGGVASAEWLKSGRYHLESMGKKHEATLHLRSPFDPKGMRIKGVYDDRDDAATMTGAAAARVA